MVALSGASMMVTKPEEASVIGRLLDARDEETGAPLDPEALRNEAAVLFMAGHETTANALAWTWYLLSQAPEVEARLHAELDTVLGDRPPTLADVPRLVYTRAVFDEVVRLYPPVVILPFKGNGSRRAPWSPGCTVTRSCGTGRITSSPSASCPATRGRRRNSPTCPSASARACAWAWPSASPRPCSAQ